MAQSIDPTKPLAPKDGKLALMVVSDARVQWFPLADGQRAVIGRDPGCEVFVEDASLSREHAAVVVRGSRVELEDLGSSNGSSVGGAAARPGARVVLPLDAVAELGSTVVVLRRRSAVPADALGPYRRAQERILRAAQGEANVLLLGESGVGKRTLAEAMHAAAGDVGSLRVTQCAGLDDAALRRWPDEPSAWQLLVRVAETPRALQSALAAAIEAHRGRVVMTSRVETAVLVRTRQAEPALVRAMQTLTFVVPALRDCGPEILSLADSMVEAIAVEQGRTITPAPSKQARAWLLERPWPDNLRELRARLLDASRLAEGDVIGVAQLEADFGAMSASDRERQRIVDALRHCAGNQTSAAKLLGLSRRALVYRLDKYGIERPRKGEG